VLHLKPLIFLYLMGSTALIFYMLPSLALHWRIVFFLVWVAGVIFMVYHTFEPIEQHFISASHGVP